MSARNVPLPESVADLDVDSHVSPDDSISQVGSRAHRHRSHRSSKGSRADDHVSPADSVSQVSRASQRTAKAGEGSKAGSRRGSQVV